MNRPLLLLLALPLLAPTGCGYRVLDPEIGQGRRMTVPVPENDTRWRGIEGVLGQSLRRDLQRQLDLNLTDQTPDWILHTKIRDVERAAPVRQIGTGGAALGSSRVEIEWSLESPTTKVLAQGTIQRQLEFLPSESEDAYQAIGEILDATAEQVVMEVGVQIASLAENS